MDADSFNLNMKADDIYKDIAEDVETRFHTSNYELVQPLPKGKKIIWINESWISWKNHDKSCRVKYGLSL